jgi:hypothetical protein
VLKSKNTVSAHLYEIAYRTNSENPSSKPLQKACSGFPIAAYDPEIVPKAGHECTLEKSNQ